MKVTCIFITKVKAKNENNPHFKKGFFVLSEYESHHSYLDEEFEKKHFLIITTAPKKIKPFKTNKPLLKLFEQEIQLTPKSTQFIHFGNLSYCYIVDSEQIYCTTLIQKI